MWKQENEMERAVAEVLDSGLRQLRDYRTKESAEDILETICALQRAHERVTADQIFTQRGIEKAEGMEWLRRLDMDGYLHLDADGVVALTPFGRIRGELCLKKHRYLTEFLKYVCGVDEDSAESNACSMEHIISEDVFSGICAFMQQGDTYDRVVRGNDLSFLYPEGSYWFFMSLYDSGDAFPRQLGQEFYWLEHDVLAEIGAHSAVYLRPSPLMPPKAGALVYLADDGHWQRATLGDKGWAIPGAAFAYRICRKTPVTEAELKLAFVDKDQEIPAAEAVRELVVHLWQV